jgi:hypothetical protein
LETLEKGSVSWGGCVEGKKDPSGDRRKISLRNKKRAYGRK